MKMKKTKKKKKLSLKQAARELTSIAEAHLSRLPEEEIEGRISSFERTISRASYRSLSKPAKNADTRVTQVAARGRE
jgi:hypothetical protein